MSKGRPTPSRAAPPGGTLPPSGPLCRVPSKGKRCHRQAVKHLSVMVSALSFLVVCIAERDAPVSILCMFHGFLQRYDVVCGQSIYNDLARKKAEAAHMSVSFVDMFPGLPPPIRVTEPLRLGILSAFLRLLWAGEAQRMHVATPFARLQHTEPPMQKRLRDAPKPLCNHLMLKE